MSIIAGESRKNRTRKRNKLKKVSFDAETVPKELAKEIIQNSSSSQADSTSSQPDKKRIKKKKKDKQPVNDNQTSNNIETRQPNSADDKNHEGENDEATKPAEAKDQENAAKAPTSKSDSKRAQKRKKHELILAEKKVKVEVTMQTKCLGYLTLWKHNRNEWKFEKLKQIWLQQSMFDSDKVPDQFWEILLAYIGNAKGKIRGIIVGEANKIIEEEAEKQTDREGGEETVEMSFDDVKLQRARDVLQNLHEWMSHVSFF